MKLKTFTGGINMLLFVSAMLLLPNIAGKWTGVLTMPGGNTATFHYLFKTNNNSFTGTASGTNDFDISNGKIYGDSLSFTIIVANGDSILNVGKYYRDGDSIQLNAAFMGAILHGTLKRDKE
jgi:hypothetical protein